MRKVALSADAMTAPWSLAGMPKETAVLLALSGGADSVALFHLLRKQAERDGFSLSVAHFDHGIRGEDSRRDAAFCRELAETHQCPFYTEQGEIPRVARQTHRGLEEVAREARYAFFDRVMRENRIPILVTAHHADDQLETLLFRLCRGTGAAGLCGIAPSRAFGDGALVRPLLPFSKKEVLAFCKSEGLSFVTDETNDDTVYTRNRIRHEVIPVLETVVPSPQTSAVRLAASLSEDEDCLASLARELIERNATERGIAAEALREAHPAIRKRALAMLSPKPPEAVHLEAVERLLTTGKSGSLCPLPGGAVACLQGEELLILPDLRRACLPDRVPFREGEMSFCDGGLIVSVKGIEPFRENANVHKIETNMCIIEEALSADASPLWYWRGRQNGDCFRWKGRSRRLADCYREAGIPTLLRDALPLLCDRDGILYAPLLGVREPQRKDGKESARAWELSIELRDVKK